jgi:hypothetical protein
MINNLSIYLTDGMYNELQNRSGTSDISYVIERDLARLYKLYHSVRLKLKDTFTTEELCVIVASLNGSLFNLDFGECLESVIWEAIEYEWTNQWNVDEKALIEKIAQLEHVQKLAIIDASERFWSLSIVNPMGDIQEKVLQSFKP